MRVCGLGLWTAAVVCVCLCVCLCPATDAALLRAGNPPKSKPKPTTTTPTTPSTTSPKKALFAAKKVDLTTFVPKLTLRLIPAGLKLDRAAPPGAPPTPLDLLTTTPGVDVTPVQPKSSLETDNNAAPLTAAQVEAELHGPDESRQPRRTPAPKNPRSPDCPMQPRWSHSAAYLYGSVYVFGGISSISVPSSVPLHNDVWSFGAQQWDLYQGDQDPCPWPVPPPDSEKPAMYRPASVPPFPVTNESDWQQPDPAESPASRPPLVPVVATVTRFAPPPPPPPPPSSSLLELSSKQRLHAILPDPKYFQPYASVRMPRDDLWQFDLATRKWSQPATLGEQAASASPPSTDTDTDTNTDTNGRFRFSSARFRSLRGQGRDASWRRRRSGRTQSMAGDGHALFRGNSGRSGTFGGAMSRRYDPAVVPAGPIATGVGGEDMRFTGSTSSPPQLKTTDHFPNPHKSPYKQLRILGPTARWLHTMVVMDKKLVVFGGVTHDYVLHDDVWAFDPEFQAWDPLYAGQVGLSLADSIGLQQYTPASIEAVAGSTFQISPREGHSAVVLKAAGFGKPGTDTSPPTMLVYGGISGSLTPADRGVWAFVMKPKVEWTWSAAATPKQTGEPPTRWLHAASAFACKTPPCMIVFGGCSPHLLALNDAWMYSMASNTFTELKPTGQQLPPGRWLHTMVGVRAPKLGVVPRYIPSVEEYDLHKGLQAQMDKAKNATSSSPSSPSSPSSSSSPWSPSVPDNNQPTASSGDRNMFLETGARLLPVDPPSSAYGVPTGVPSAMLVFGGAADQNRFHADTWLLTVDDAVTPPTCFWELLNPTTGEPEAREGHAAVVVEASEVPPGTPPPPPPDGTPPTEPPRPMQGAQWMLVVGGFSGDPTRTLPDLPVMPQSPDNSPVVPTAEQEASTSYSLKDGALVAKKEGV